MLFYGVSNLTVLCLTVVMNREIPSQMGYCRFLVLLSEKNIHLQY